jgi:hypothetical protein
MARKVIVKDLLKSENCYDREQGTVLYKVLLDSLINRQAVEVDFTGIQTITSAFLNSSFGELLKCRPQIPVVKKLVKVTYIDNFSKKILNKVMTNKVAKLVVDNPCQDCPYTNCIHHP